MWTPWGKEVPIAVVEYRIVETEKARSYEETTDVLESVAALKHQPGFRHLLNKLQLQSDRLKHELTSERKSTVEEYQFLQSGVFWCDWLSNQLSNADARISFRKPTPSETSSLQAVPLEYVSVDK